MFVIKIILLFFLGSALGSFTNVLVDRGQRNKSLQGRSKCDFCGKKLSWSENIPILGFFLVGGKCLGCKKKLSWQYPLVELVMAWAFVFVGWISGFFSRPFSIFESLEISYLLFVVFLLLAIFLWDLKYMIIPDSLVFAGVVVAFLFLLLKYSQASCSLFDLHCPVAAGLLGGLIISGFFYLQYFFSKGKIIGGGDVKLGFFLGMIVGLKFAYLLLLLAYVLGAAVSVFLLLRKKKGLKAQIPFGPFLVSGALIVLFFGEKLIYLYKQLIY